MRRSSELDNITDHGPWSGKAWHASVGSWLDSPPLVAEKLDIYPFQKESRRQKFIECIRDDRGHLHVRGMLAWLFESSVEDAWRKCTQLQWVKTLKDILKVHILDKLCSTHPCMQTGSIGKESARVGEWVFDYGMTELF